eukprot:XP_429578.1 uncharacterized protein LOC418423 [Gallus gallus]
MGNCQPKIRWKMSIPVWRKRYSNKETQTESHPPSPAQEHCDRKGSINTSGVWYSTVSHNDKPESCAANTKTQTEYAVVNVPRNKQCTIYSEDQNAYDYVLIH